MAESGRPEDIPGDSGGGAWAADAAFYRTLFARNPAPMWIYDAETLRLLQANHAAQALFGYSEAELCAMTIADLRTPEEQARLRAALEGYDAGARSAGRWQLRAKSGAYIDVEIDWLRLEVAGRPAVLATLRDITQQVLTEAALRQVEARFQAISLHAPVGLTIKDVEGRYQFCNAEAQRGLGISGPYIGRTTRELIGDAAAAIEAGDRQVLETGRAAIFEIEPPAGSSPVERTLVVKFPIHDASGRIAAIGSFAVDLTREKRAERALRGVEQRFARAVSLVEAAIWIHDAGTIVFANPAAARLHGAADAAALVGRTIVSLLHPDDRDRVQARIDSLMREEQTLPTALVRFRGLDGRERLVEVQAAPLRQDGQLLIVSSGRDVTERVRIEAELRQIEARFESLVQNAPIAINIRDTDGRYRYLNAEAERVMGLPSGACIGRKVREVTDPATAAIAEEADRKVLESGQPLVAEGNPPSGIPYESTLMVRLPMRDGAGAVIGVGSFAIDVTKQKRAEQALAESESQRRATEQRYQRVVDLVQEAIWIHDQGTLVFANPAAARLYGAPDAAALIGRSVFDFLGADDRARALRRTAKMMGDLQPLPPAEMRIIGLDGRKRVAELQAVPFRQEDRLLVVASGRDVTAQRDAEARLLQAQKMEAVGQLTGGIAHDFNNLLTIIIGALDQDPARLPPELAPLIEQAMHAAERGASLTHRLLAFSRRQTLIAGAVDFNRLVAGMEDLLRRTLGEQIEIDMVLSGELWPALADASQVENALLNLAINARDAMEDGGTLTIETSNAHLDEDFAAANPGVAVGDYAMLAVSDTGSGMSPDVLARAFEPFFTTKEVGKGTGLGLATIYGFAKQSRGHVAIYSELGHGTTVKLYLPRLQADASRAAEGPAPQGAEGGGETILVVEDDPNVRKLVLRQLTDLGYQVIEAANGKAAMQVIESGVSIDLLFTDVVMPGGMNGQQLADAARQRRPGLKTLFTSGYTADTIQRQGKVEPGTLLLSKPYRKRDLAEKIREALES